MLMHKKIDYYVIFQVLLFNVAIFITTHLLLAPYIKIAMQTEFVQSVTNQFLFLMPHTIVRSWLARYIYLGMALAFYALFMRLFEKNKNYPSLLTKQPIFWPLFLGLLSTAILHCLILLISSSLGFMHVVEYGSKAFEIFALGLGLDLIIKFSNDLAEELMFRGYTITRLEPEIGALRAALFSALLFMVSHLYLPVPLISYQVLHWFLYGLLFAYMFLITRSIYFTTGMHLGLNVLTNHIMNIWLTLDVSWQYDWVASVCIIGAIISAICWYEKRTKKPGLLPV